MRLNEAELKDLAINTARAAEAKAPMNFSKSDGTAVSLTFREMNETLREEIAEMTKTARAYEENKYALFEIITEVVDERLPRDLGQILDGFVEVHQYGNNDVPEIELRRKNHQWRGRSFVTLGTPAGQYEVFKIAKPGRLPIAMTAATGAVAIPYEDFVNGRVDWNELIEIVEQGILDVIYSEVIRNFDFVRKQLPAANQKSSTDFEEDVLSDLLGITEAYGSPTILCTARFARKITDGAEWASEAEKLARRKVGYMTDYKNAKIVVLPQTFMDETNEVKALDDETAYIIPEGDQSIFHLALQGETHMKEFNEQGDWSKELHLYKKFGVGSVVNYGVTVYTIDSLKSDN